jgi:hypothetical protein
MQDFFRCVPGLEARVDVVAANRCKKFMTDMHYEVRLQKIVIDMHYEACLQCIINYWAGLGRKVSKADACVMTLTQEQYIVVNTEH